MLETCEPNCRCQCDYDVEACREFRAAMLRKSRHKQLVQEAYDKARGAAMRELEGESDE